METFNCEVDQTLCKLLNKKGELLMNASYYYQMKNNKACNGRWELSNSPIGEVSAHATVYLSLCKDDDDNKSVDQVEEKRYIAKIMKPDHPVHALNEIKAQMEISNSPCKAYTIPISQAFVNKDQTMFILIMPFVEGMTVKRYIELELRNKEPNIEKIKKIIDQCKLIITRLFKFCYYLHSDTHLNNFMIKNNGDLSTLKLIDFGKAEPVMPNPTDDQKRKFQRDLDMIDASFNSI
jgi:serine/threonine protein kinase